MHAQLVPNPLSFHEVESVLVNILVNDADVMCVRFCFSEEKRGEKGR